MIAIDFDDTILSFESKEKCSKIIKLIKKAKKLGCTIILFTCREGESLKWAKLFLKSIGIIPDYINENPILNSRKPYYNILLDDKAGLGQAYECLNKVIEIIEKELTK